MNFSEIENYIRNHVRRLQIIDEILKGALFSKAGVMRFGDKDNYTQVATDGTLTFAGEGTGFDDLRIEPTARNTGAKAPTFGVFRDGLYAYQFDDVGAGSEKEIFFQVQMPHAWKEGSTVYPHVHWSPLVAGSAGNAVRWGMEYSKAKLGNAFPSTATTTVYTSAVTLGTITTQYSHCLSAFAGISMTGDTLSTVIMGRLFRNSSHADDTLAQTVGLLYIDWHYEIDAVGSRTEYTK